MAKKFDKPLGEIVTEYREVEQSAYVVDKDGQIREEKIKRRIPEQVIYTKAKPKFFTCKSGEHVWEMIDRHQYLASCRNCPKHRYLRADRETIKDGHIVERETGRVID